MDSERLKQITAIVKTMSEHGISQSEVRANLKQLGLSAEETEQVVQAAGVAATAKDIHAQVTAVREKIDSGEHLQPLVELHAKSTQEIKEEISEVAEGVQEHAESLEAHGEKLEDISAGLEALHEKHDELSEKFADAPDVSKQLKEIKQLLLDLKPQVAALRDINQKILDTNREVLMRLKK